MAGELTQEQLKEQVQYDPTSGVFTWRAARSGVPHRSIAGSPNNLGYIKITILRKHYYAHRLAWFYMTGEWPPHSIDHINQNPSDNRWINLRAATHSENHRNVSLRSDSTSGIKGVSLHKETGKWRAHIKINGKAKHLGLFHTIEEAARVRQAAADKIHGQFARHE